MAKVVPAGAASIDCNGVAGLSLGSYNTAPKTWSQLLSCFSVGILSVPTSGYIGQWSF